MLAFIVISVIVAIPTFLNNNLKENTDFYLDQLKLWSKWKTQFVQDLSQTLDEIPPPKQSCRADLSANTWE